MILTNVFQIVNELFIVLFLFSALCISLCETLFILPEMLSTDVVSTLYPALS